MEPDPYASLERMIRLPKKHKLSDHTKLFSPISRGKDKQFQLSEPLLLKTNALLQELNETFEIYEHPHNFQFDFPDSMFPPVPENEYNRIRYEQKMISEQENTFKDRLSEEQLSEIQQNGEFKVKSNVEYITLPYVWKINESIFWGKKKVEEMWKKSLASIYGFFWGAYRYMINQIPRQITIIKSIPNSLFKLFFGKKSLQTLVSVDYQRQIFKDFWNKILKEHYQENENWFNAIWQYLYVYYDPEITRPIKYTKDKEQNKKLQAEKKKIQEKYNSQVFISDDKMNIIEKVSQDFNQEWAKLRKKTIIEITQEVSVSNNSFEHRPESDDGLLLSENKEIQQNEKDQIILEKLAERKFSLYINHFKAQLPKVDVPIDVTNAIILILRLFSLIANRDNKVAREKQKKMKGIEQRIKKQFKIKSLFRPFLDELVRKEMEPISKSLENEMYKSLPTDLEITKFLNKAQLQAYAEFLQLRSQYDIRMQAKKLQVPEYHGPTRVFYSNYHLFPPYAVTKDGNYYNLKKVSDNLTVDTSQNFWKFSLYWMRLKTWTINSLFYLFGSVWKGPIGVRALWGVEDYGYDMNINSSTGEIYYSTTKTVLGLFKSVLEGIKKSRNNFQQAPDLGLLGKNVSRIFNYIECYLFRLLFVGILLVLIGFPILIIVASTITVVLVVTFWAWMPLVLVVTYLFNIFIKQFETERDAYGFMSRTFPLLRIVLRLLFAILIMVISVLNLIIWTPLRAAFWFMVAGVVSLFRRVLDKIMMFIFRNLGRTPSRDTLVAKKISGPGMTKDFYMSINEEDVYILMRASLQRKFMVKLNQLIITKLNKHSSILNKIMSQVLKPFAAYYNSRDDVRDNCNQLLSNYSNQYRGYMNRYPNNPQNVRFTQEEIDNYFPNTVNIVKNFVEKFQIHSWIFEDYELYQGMYDELTRSIWIEMFGCGEEIFEPLEKLDARFKLEDQYNNESDNIFNVKMKKGVGSVMKALEGEVQISHHHKKLTPFKHNLLNRELGTENVSSLFTFVRNNCRQSVSLDIKDIKSFFVPNLNIKEITIVDNEKRERNIKNQPLIVDL